MNNQEVKDLSEDIKAICLPLVSHPDKVAVSLSQNDRRTQAYLIRCEENDMGKLIGRHGLISDSLRAVVNISMRAHRKKISLKFESISEGR